MKYMRKETMAIW